MNKGGSCCLMKFTIKGSAGGVEVEGIGSFLNSTSWNPDFLRTDNTASIEGPDEECAMEVSPIPLGIAVIVEARKKDSCKNHFDG